MSSKSTSIEPAICPDESSLSHEIRLIRQQQDALYTMLAVEQGALKELARRLWSQQEAERSRLSRDLHDGVGQLLTALTRRLQGMSESDPALAEMADVAAQALTDVRQLSRLMRPTILDDLGLGPGLNWLTRTLFEHEDCNCTLELDLPADLPADIAILIFRIVQEALVNCVKHAEATEVKLYASASGKVVRVDILDNGKGFDMASQQSGIGLASMRDRARAFDADLTLESQPGKGCHVSMVVSL